jgi:hypothetical protein
MPADLPFPHSLLELIKSCVPTLQAAEVLSFFASHPDRDFSIEEVVVCMRPAVITVPAVREYTALFAGHSLVTEATGRFRYDPQSVELERAIGELAHAYNERPVTLIRVLYHIPPTARSSPLPTRSSCETIDL